MRKRFLLKKWPSYHKLAELSKFVLIPKYYYAYQIKENEVGKAWERRGEGSVQGFGGKARRKETT
jgi:hypothetical protein